MQISRMKPRLIVASLRVTWTASPSISAASVERGLVAVGRREVADADPVADDPRDQRSPAVVELLPRAAQPVVVPGARPDLHPQGPVVVRRAGVDQPQELGRRVLDRRQRGRELRLEALLVGDQRLGQQLVLGLEPVEDRGRAGADALGDVGDPGRRHPALGDHLGRRRQ